MIYYLTKAIMKEDEEAQKSWFIRHKEWIAKAASVKLYLPFIGKFQWIFPKLKFRQVFFSVYPIFGFIPVFFMGQSPDVICTSGGAVGRILSIVLGSGLCAVMILLAVMLWYSTNFVFLIF